MLMMISFLLTISFDLWQATTSNEINFLNFQKVIARIIIKRRPNNPIRINATLMPGDKEDEKDWIANILLILSAYLIMFAGVRAFKDIAWQYALELHKVTLTGACELMPVRQHCSLQVLPNWSDSQLVAVIVSVRFI
jgi:hypothetical protein